MVMLVDILFFTQECDRTTVVQLGTIQHLHAVNP
jgi:hypothetical protein